MAGLCKLNSTMLLCEDREGRVGEGEGRGEKRRIGEKERARRKENRLATMTKVWMQEYGRREMKKPRLINDEQIMM